MLDLTDQVAFITGGASGMGAATAQRLAGLGATVVVADLDGDGAARVVAELDNPRHRHIVLDVGSAAQWDRVVHDVVDELGRLDIVHLNAGIMTRPPQAPLDDPWNWLTESSYRKVMSVNLDGVVLGLIAALPHLAARGGDVVVTASIAGLQPLGFDPFYALSKHALVGLVRSLHGLQSRNIRVNAICPGGVDTAIVPDELRAAHIVMSPPSYIADVVVQVLESCTGGAVWVARSEAQGAWPIDPPVLTAPVHLPV
jgi:NAD(P)-dependent dehydrogenase (short-subunit alcohol dehydrogenase family)